MGLACSERVRGRGNKGEGLSFKPGSAILPRLPQCALLDRYF